MKNSLRYIIREQIEKLLEGESFLAKTKEEYMKMLNDNYSTDIENIDSQSLDKKNKDIEFLDNSEKEMQAIIKYEKERLRADKQVRGNTPTTITVAGNDLPNPKRKALDQELPASDKVLKAREKNLKNIEIQKKEIQQKADVDIKAVIATKAGVESSVLPSTDSPI